MTIAWEIVERCGRGLERCAIRPVELKYRLIIYPYGESYLESAPRVDLGDLHYIRSRIRLSADRESIVIEGAAEGVEVDGAFIQPRKGREELSFREACVRIGGEYARRGEYEICSIKGEVTIVEDYVTDRVRIDNIDIENTRTVITEHRGELDPYYPERIITLTCIDKPCIVVKHGDRIIIPE
ncbi:MAG: hypothetical protein GXO26_08190 [Crenarchaeota archaeon]|nr:hypothetical protein [Thermoproteota archaeon]